MDGLREQQSDIVQRLNAAVEVLYLSAEMISFVWPS